MLTLANKKQSIIFITELQDLIIFFKKIGVEGVVFKLVAFIQKFQKHLLKFSILAYDKKECKRIKSLS